MPVDVVSFLSKYLLPNNSQQKETFQRDFDNLSREAIEKAIPDILHSNGAPNLIRLILEGLSNSNQSRNNLMLKVMRSVITELCDSEAIPESCVVDIVHIISMNSHELSSTDLAELVKLCLSFIQAGKNIQGKWLSVFPMIFSELSKQNRVAVDKESMTGVEFCSEIITTLCNTTIATEDAVAFTAILRELKMPTNSITRFVEKLCAIIPEMEPQEVPPLVYQLLFLCDQSDHLVPLQHLATFFQAKLRRCASTVNNSGGESMDIDSDLIETGSLKEILQAKATSIFHISRAAATGHPLGKEFLKFIRNRRNIPELVLVPFILEVALSLGGLPQLRDLIELLRTVVQSCLQSNEKQRHSAYMREMMLGKEIDVQDLLNTIMQQATSEGDNVFKGLELLAFSLLEIRNPGFPGRPGTAGSSSAPGTAQGSSSATSPVTQQCWNIGSHILLQMIKKFPDSAPLIVQKLVERLQDVGNDSQYITTISLMVQHNPLSMLDCKVSVTALLYSMDFRGVASAKRLYAGISPLFRSSGALRDSAFVVLRKLLHSCSEDARQVAVVGFLQILKNFRYYPQAMSSSLSQSSISSQATVDVHHNQTSNTNRAFCSELIKLLQCALSQQSVVRLTLYQSLPEVVSRNPELLPECIKMLRCHLKFFVDPESGVQLEFCVAKDGNSAHVIEPLGQLIQAILQTILRSGKVDYLKKEDIDAKSEDQVDLGVLLLRKLVHSIAQSSAEDYALGDIQESCPHLKVQTLSSVCVALADFCLAQDATTKTQAAKHLVKLFELHSHFDSLVSESAGKGKGKGKATKGAKTKGKDNTIEGSPTKDETAKTPKKPFDMCTLSLQNIALFIRFLDESNHSGDEEIIAYFKLPAQNKLRLWVIQSALIKYQVFRNHGEIEGLSPESVAKFSESIGHALLIHCQKARQVVEDNAVIYCAALNCLNEMIHSFCKHHPAKLNRVLMAMDGVKRTTTGALLEHQLVKSLQHFKDILNHLLSGRENEDFVVKAVVPVIGIITLLSDQLDPAGEQYSELLEWTLKLCKDVECTESSIVKVLMNLLLHLSMTAESSPNVLEDMAKEVHLAIGTLGDDNSTTAPPNKFSTINDDTAAVVLTILVVRLEQLLQTVEWAMPRIGVIERGDASPMVERSIYARLKLIVHALSELVLADISPGPNSELILKLATSLYTTMSRIAKKQTKTILPVFRSLVRAIATQLTANLNTFIMHLDGKEGKGTKRKRGDKEKTGVTKMVKSARSIPALTYASEQYSQAILAVSKRTKEDLSFGFKLGTTRDFRIKADKVHQALEDGEANSESQESESSDDDEMEGNNSRSQTTQNETRLRGTARRSRGRGRGRGKFTSVGKATGLTNK